MHRPGEAWLAGDFEGGSYSAELLELYGVTLPRKLSLETKASRLLVVVRLIELPLVRFRRYGVNPKVTLRGFVPSVPAAIRENEKFTRPRRVAKFHCDIGDKKAPGFVFPEEIIDRALEPGAVEPRALLVGRIGRLSCLKRPPLLAGRLGRPQINGDFCYLYT